MQSIPARVNDVEQTGHARTDGQTAAGHAVPVSLPALATS